MAKRVSPAAPGWLLALFGLPFACGGIAVFLLAAWPALHDWGVTQSWQPVQAELLSASLEEKRGSKGSSSWMATASYRYRYQGNEYTGNRVGLFSGSDNIGQWQQAHAAQLQVALQQHQPVTVYVDPLHPSKAIIDRSMRPGLLALLAGFSLAFGSVGVGLVVFGLFGSRAGKTGVTDPQQPWLERKEWASEELVARQQGSTIALWFFALVWCAISAAASSAIPGELQKGNQAVWFLLVFDLLGLALIVAAIHQTLGARRFGDTRLRLDPWPGSVAGQVGGAIEVKLPHDPTLIFTIDLACIHHYHTGRGNNRDAHRNAVWQDSRCVMGEPSGDGNTRVWFSFDVPDGLPVSGAPGADYHDWQLRAAAVLEGVDFSRQWSVPVFATGQKSREAAQRMRESNEQRLARIESLMNLRQVPGGISLDFHAGRSLGAGLVMLLVGAVFLGGGLFLGRQAGDFGGSVVSLVLAGVGPALLGLGVWLVANRLQVQVDASRLAIRRSLFGVAVYRRDLPLPGLRGIGIRQGMTVQKCSHSTVYYRLVVETPDGQCCTIGDGFAGYSEAVQAAEAVALYARLPVLPASGKG